MTIVRNILPRPQLDDTTGMLATGGTLAVAVVSTQWPFENGAKMVLQTSTGAATSMLAYWQLTGGDRFPVAEGYTVAFRTWFATDTGMRVRVGIQFYDGAGASLPGSVGPYATGRFYNGGTVEHSAVAPAGAATARFYVASDLSAGGTLTAGLRTWFDRACAYVEWRGDAVAAALAAGYLDGDRPGWIWEGERFASPSRGPLELYLPDAELLRSGVRVAWLDSIDGWEEEHRSLSTVQTSPTPAVGGRVTVHVMPAGNYTGTLTVHLSRILGDGDPGDRARALVNQLRTGAPILLRWYNSRPGLGGDVDLVPVGAIRARPARLSAAGAWTVEFDFEAIRA